MPPLDSAVLPAGIRSRVVPDINGLRMHILEAGHEIPGRPCVLLLHGFPELAYSWRNVMLPLAPRSSGTISAHRSRPGVPSCGPTYSAPWS